MALVQADYAGVRKRMQPGDVIAFSGKGDVSNIIKWATRSQVSHAACILQSKLLLGGTPQAGMLNQIIESTAPLGVSISRLSERLAGYQGEAWWLPLSLEVRARMNGSKLFDWLLHQERRPYDWPQAIASGIDLFGGAIIRAQEDFARFFCSELIAGALEAAGAVASLNASEVTPADLCAFRIYASDYYQIKGVPKEIRGFNRLEPAGWGG